jgi:hypothetical protein
MFNITKEVNRLQQLKHAKVHGLPIIRQPKSPKIQHVDGIPYEIAAVQESIAISKGFKNKSKDFGRQLSKAKGQRHHPGGGFAGHTIKE